MARSSCSSARTGTWRCWPTTRPRYRPLCTVCWAARWSSTRRARARQREPPSVSVGRGCVPGSGLNVDLDRAVLLPELEADDLQDGDVDGAALLRARLVDAHLPRGHLLAVPGAGDDDQLTLCRSWHGEEL